MYPPLPVLLPSKKRGGNKTIWKKKTPKETHRITITQPYTISGRQPHNKLTLDSKPLNILSLLKYSADNSDIKQNKNKNKITMNI